ncbi:hypothetical protein BDP81DRAFT_125391 [Colletotrichum phormii]|uniref:Uncharacterized protein n=1 Tax=Colletotrichum phormii TaxID=359342 RepID=A0AAI9ZZ89_9PEZI|nr:uncharacterized protein BDP81DRAFT_125391 [Colletotrichum phormii]KAK1640970.1 hypothetical protein BDP81DRAFT_125391 [Colletotrichum phormii]
MFRACVRRRLVCMANAPRARRFCPLFSFSHSGKAQTARSRQRCWRPAGLWGNRETHPADVDDVPAGRILQRRSYTPSASASFLFGFGTWGLSLSLSLSLSLAGLFSSSTGSSCCSSISPFTRASSQSFIILRFILPLGSSQSRHVIVGTLQCFQNHGLLPYGMRINPPSSQGVFLSMVSPAAEPAIGNFGMDSAKIHGLGRPPLDSSWRLKSAQCSDVLRKGEAGTS